MGMAAPASFPSLFGPLSSSFHSHTMRLHSEMLPVVTQQPCLAICPSTGELGLFSIVLLLRRIFWSLWFDGYFLQHYSGIVYLLQCYSGIMAYTLLVKYAQLTVCIRYYPYGSGKIPREINFHGREIYFSSQPQGISVYSGRQGTMVEAAICAGRTVNELGTLQ